MNLIPYLLFDGSARDALELYKKAFVGEIVDTQTYGAMNPADPNASKLMHSEFKAPGVHLMASDDMQGFQVRTGNNASMSLHSSDLAETTRVFHTLAEGGKVNQPLIAAPWGGHFGQLVDQFGIQWMFNCVQK